MINNTPQHSTTLHNTTKTILIFLVLICCSFFACKKDNPTTSDSSTTSNSYTITFNTNGGNVVPSLSVSKTQNAQLQYDPSFPSYKKIVKDDIAAKGWYADAQGKVLFDMANKIISDTTIYAIYPPKIFGVYAKEFTTNNDSNSFTIIIKDDGTLWGYGYNKDGQLGLGDFTNVTSATQIGKEKWKAISADWNSVVAIKSDGTLWTWGNNKFGQLGDGTTISKNLPTKIGDFNNCAQVFKSLNTCAMITEDGRMFLWGENKSSVCGDGTTTNVLKPKELITSVKWKKIAINQFYANYVLAIKEDGTLWFWSLVNYPYMESNVLKNGLIGNGTPIQIGTEKWIDIVNGRDFEYGIKDDGSLVPIGLEKQPNNTFNVRNYPRWTNLDKNWKLTSSTVSNLHSFFMAIKTDGSLWYWGSDYYGSAGIGDLYVGRYSDYPTKIGTALDWKFVMPGKRETFAIKNDNSVWIASENFKFTYRDLILYKNTANTPNAGYLPFVFY